jgi:hypothetical protein
MDPQPQGQQKREQTQAESDELGIIGWVFGVPIGILVCAIALCLVWAVFHFAWMAVKSGASYVVSSITAPRVEPKADMDDILKKLNVNPKTMQSIQRSWNKLMKTHSLDSTWESLTPLVVELASDGSGSLEVLNDILLRASMEPKPGLPAGLENRTDVKVKMLQAVLRGSALVRFRDDLKICEGRPDEALCNNAIATRVVFRAQEFTDRCVRQALPSN